MTTRMMAVATIALGLAGTLPAAAQQTTHGCACFHNKTGVTINYRYKWASGEWHNVKLPANHQGWICWKYDGERKSSPNLSFQLDVDMSKGSAWTTYAITRVQTAGASCNAVGKGGHYDISYRPNTNNAFIHVTRRP